MDDTLLMKALTHGQPLNAEQQKIRDEAQTKIASLMREALDWSKVEPLMVEAYRNALTREEAKAMLKFYTSPIGQSVGAKLPAVSEQMRKLMQQRMNEILPQIVAVRNDETERIVAAGPPAAAAGGTAEPAQPAVLTPE